MILYCNLVSNNVEVKFLIKILDAVTYERLQFNKSEKNYFFILQRRQF